MKFVIICFLWYFIFNAFSYDIVFIMVSMAMVSIAMVSMVMVSIAMVSMVMVSIGMSHAHLVMNSLVVRYEGSRSSYCACEESELIT